MTLKKAFFILEHGSSEGEDKYLEAVKAIKEKCMPVVRCENCVFSQLDGWVCGGTTLMPPHRTFPNSFCNYGTRKDEANES